MYAAPTALAAEIFGKNKPTLLLIALAFPSVWILAAAWLGTLHTLGLAFQIPVGFTLGSILALRLACAFCYVDPAAESLNNGFPQRILVLPAPTWLLALVPLATGAICVTLFALAWLRFAAGVQLEWIQLPVIAGAIAAGLSWTQAALWKLVPTVLLRIIVFGAAASLVAYSAVSILSQGNHLLDKTGGALGLVASLLGGWYCAYRAVVLARRGDAVDQASYLQRLRLRMPLRSHSRVPILTNAAAAQNWFEWHVFGFWLPLLSLTEFVLLLPRLFLKWHAPLAVDIMMLASLYMMLLLMAGGFYAQRSPTSPSEQLSSFHATLPLRNLDLAFAKLNLTVKCHLLSFGVLLAAFTTLILLNDDNSELICGWSWLETHLGSSGAASCVFLLTLLAAAMTWAASVYVMSTRLFVAGMKWKGQRWEIINVPLYALALLLWFKPSIWRYLSSLPVLVESAHLLVLLPATLIIGCGLALLPRFRRLNPLSELKGVGIAFCVALAACLILIWQLNLSFGYRWAFSWLACAAAGVTFIPCLLVPVVIGLQRHR